MAGASKIDQRKVRMPGEECGDDLLILFGFTRACRVDKPASVGNEIGRPRQHRELRLCDTGHIARHVVCEIRMNGSWAVFDPTSGLDFRRADGRLSLDEFVNALFKDFETMDTDGDGKLTIEEIEVYVRVNRR